MQNGLFCNLNEGSTGSIDVSTSPGSGGSSIADELADLRRQVVFLQGQVEDRDRTIQLLEVNNELNSHCDFNNMRFCVRSLFLVFFLSVILSINRSG